MSRQINCKKKKKNRVKTNSEEYKKRKNQKTKKKTLFRNIIVLRGDERACGGRVDRAQMHTRDGRKKFK